CWLQARTRIFSVDDALVAIPSCLRDQGQLRVANAFAKAEVTAGLPQSGMRNMAEQRPTNELVATKQRLPSVPGR
ncbi:hypothetical protein ACFL6U_22395, partial [Planctomycetota bacterium]